MSGSFVKRKIDVTITLGTGTIGQTGFNTVKLSGHRVVCSILKAGSPSFDSAEIRIYGVVPSIMNSVSTLGIPIPMTRIENTVTIEAGDDVNGMAVVYRGQIKSVWRDMEAAPDTCLHIIGIGAKLAAMAPIAPTSIPGGADVATIMAGLAAQANMVFENNGVQVRVANPYLPGTALDQIYALGRAADIEVYVDTGSAPQNTLAIWPKNGTRGGLIPLISAGTGLIGYPQWNDKGMAFRCLLNTSLKIGGRLTMKSIIGGTAAPLKPTIQQAIEAGPNGEWYIRGPLSYDLASELPDGPWFCDVICGRTLGP